MEGWTLRHCFGGKSRKIYDGRIRPKDAVIKRWLRGGNQPIGFCSGSSNGGGGCSRQGKRGSVSVNGGWLKKEENLPEFEIGFFKWDRVGG
jgi:hypothetical protein